MLTNLVLHKKESGKENIEGCEDWEWWQYWPHNRIFIVSMADFFQIMILPVARNIKDIDALVYADYVFFNILLCDRQYQGARHRYAQIM